MACVEGLDQSFLKRHHYTVVVIVRVYAELGAQHLDFKAAHIYNEWVQRVFGYSKVAVAIDVYVAVVVVLVEAACAVVVETTGAATGATARSVAAAIPAYLIDFFNVNPPLDYKNLLFFNCRGAIPLTTII